MAVHEYTWLYMVIHGITWVYMAIHGNTSQNMVIHGNTWLYMHLNRLKTWHLTSPSVRPRSGMGDGLCSYNRYSPWSKSHVVIDVTGIQDQMQPLW